MSMFRARRPSPALVVSCVALVMAMGGTSYAAFTLPANSVGSKQLKNGAVKTSKIKNGAVTASKINTTGLTAPNALQANNANTAGSATNANHANNADNATNANHANNADNATNANHANSATNATNATTAASANALNGVVIVDGPTADNPASSLNFSSVTCPAGMSVISGGVLDSGGQEESINETGIAGGTFFADVGNISGANSNITARDDSFHVWAACINGSVSGAARAAVRK